MSDRYFAFISYSVAYREWAEALQKNLERCLDRYAREVDPSVSRKVFLDKVDLRSGETWIEQFQRAVERSERLILIITPEAMDSKWVKIEWQSFFTRRPTDLFPVLLVDADLSAFLAPIQWSDFRGLEGAEYQAQLARFFGDLLRQNRRAPPAMPDDLVAPKFPKPDPDRQRLEECLAPLLESPLRRRLLEPAFGLDRKTLDDTTGANAARRIATAIRFAEDPLANWIDALHVVVGEMEVDPQCDLEPLRQLAADLRRQQDEIEAQRQQAEADQGDVEKDEEEHDPIPAYLAKVAHDHANLIPLLGRRNAPLLDHMYVELKLRDDEPFHGLVKHRRDDAQGRLLDQSMTIHQVLDLDPEDYPWITRRWVVLGDPGAGKTTLMRHLARELALGEGRKLVPVFESLPRLLREKGWLLDRIETQMIQGGDRSEGLAATLDELGKRGELLVQLDGLDEVPRDKKDIATSLLKRLSKRWPKTPILVTSRPIGYRHQPGEGFLELEVQPFDGEQRLEFLNRWLGDADRAHEALAAIRTHRSVRDLAGNPLYLTLMAILVEQGEPPSQNRAHLYDQIFKLLFEGRHKRPVQPMPLADDCRETLRQLAFAMTGDNLHAEPVGQIERRFWTDGGIRQAAQPVVARWGDVRPFLDDLAEKTCILGPHDGDDADWRYWHRSFREALASEVLAQRYETGGQAAVLEAAKQIEGDESRWGEAFALLTGRVEEPDMLVKALVDSQRDLGLRALASATALDASTIGEVLALTSDQEKRVETFLQIPELLPNAASALRLIDRLRVDTRNGYDLYHLDLAAELVARKSAWADHSRAALQLRDRFYDHIPPPPTELFETVETKDGEAPLWCEIPAGRFLMGSPRDEEQNYPDEGPQHEVVVTEGFRLAAVPVTQAQYAAFDPDHRSEDHGVALRPVEQVSWFEAVAFCRWLASHTSYEGACLATEEQWEYACRAGTTTRYWSGDSEDHLERVGWYSEHGVSTTQPVGQKPANPWGLYDVHGNVEEWTASPWVGNFRARERGISHDPFSIDPTDPVPRSTASPAPLADPAAIRRVERVIRGGSFWVGAQNARSAFRGRDVPWTRDGDLGFRVLLPRASPGS